MAVTPHLTGDYVELLSQLPAAQNQGAPEAEWMLRPDNRCRNLIRRPLVDCQQGIYFLGPRRQVVLLCSSCVWILGRDCLAEFLSKLNRF